MELFGWLSAPVEYAMERNETHRYEFEAVSRLAVGELSIKGIEELSNPFVQAIKKSEMETLV